MDQLGGVIPGTSDDTAGWKEYYWQYGDAFLYHRWTITSRYSSYIYLYEIEAFMHDQKAIRVTGLQRDYVQGFKRDRLCD